MSDSDDELNVDLSQWKPRSVNTAPQPSALVPPPRTFASINTPATNHFEDDDFDIDAIVEGIADDDDHDALQSKPSTQPPTAFKKPRQTVHVVITQDPTFNRDDYIDCTYGANIVRRVLKEFARNEHVYYSVEFVDRHTEQVSTLLFHSYLLTLPIVAYTAAFPLSPRTTIASFTHYFFNHYTFLFTLIDLYKGYRAVTCLYTFIPSFL